VSAGPATAVIPVGGRTQWSVGGALTCTDGAAVHEVQAPTGVVSYDPADLTVRVGAGTTVGALAAVLADAGQECPLDPRTDDATVGGVLACGLSGWRRLRYGPVRDRVLEVRLRLADGREVKGGGPTVKNVSGYDLPRLAVGSLGTLGLITEVVLRCQPRAASASWFVAGGPDPVAVWRALARPSAVLWDGTTISVFLEGHPTDIADAVTVASLVPAPAPVAPVGPHRGRISVRPSHVLALAEGLRALDGVRWLAEVGVGTVHVACDAAVRLVAARAAAEAVGGWLLREEGGDGIDPFGRAFPGAAVAGRIRDALDPERRMNPGRLPL